MTSRVHTRSDLNSTRRMVLATMFAATILALSSGSALAVAPDDAPPCAGDCDTSGSVTVDEVLMLLGIAQGDAQVGGCSSGDGNSDGIVTVDEVLTAVASALGGCAGGSVRGVLTQTPTETALATVTPTESATEPAASASPTAPATAVETATADFGATLTATANAALTSTPAVTPTQTKPMTSTATQTKAPTQTATPSKGATATATATECVDFQIEVRRITEFVFGHTNWITIDIRNAANFEQAGPFTVTVDLPVGLRLQGTQAPAGWDCTGSSEFTLECTMSGTLAARAALPTITAGLSIDGPAGSRVTVTATVPSQCGDNSGSTTGVIHPC